MPKTHYYLVHNDDQVIELNESSFVVPVDEFGPYPTTDELVNAADNPGLSVIPLIETLEWEEDDYEEDALGRYALHLGQLAQQAEEGGNEFAASAYRYAAELAMRTP